MAETFNLMGEIEKRCGQTLRTLARRRSFELVAVGPKGLEIRVARSGKARTIPRRELEAAYEALALTERISGTERNSGREIRQMCSEYNPAYIAAVLAQMPEVTFTLHPIVLWYRSERQEALL